MCRAVLNRKRARVRASERLARLHRPAAKGRALSEAIRSLGRSYFIFAIVSSGLILISIDATIVTVALPPLLDELHSSLALISWTLTSYQLTYTIGLPL